MIKKLTYKLALVGCASTCLLGFAAYAANAGDDGALKFTKVADAENVACGADDRYLKYKVTNEGFRPIWLIKEFIEGDDSFHHHLTEIKDVDCSPFGSHKLVLPFQSCEITVKVDPVDCPHYAPVPTPNNVDRDLVVRYKTIFPATADGAVETAVIHEIDTDIEFDFTVLGSSENFSLLADGGSIKNVTPAPTDISNTSPIQVFQDTGASGFVTRQIYYQNSAVHVKDHHILDAAYSDALAAFDTINDITTPCSGTNTIIASDLVTGVTPGLYCLTLTSDEDLTTVLKFNGDGDYMFVIPNVNYTLGCTATISYELNGGAKEENIYWVGGDQITLCTGNSSGNNSFPGTIITEGTVITKRSTPTALSTSTEPVPPTPTQVPLLLDGRILVVDDCRPEEACTQDEDSFPPSAVITLDGNTIDKP